VSEAVVLQFVVDHVQRRSAEGELAWRLPPDVDQALVTAGLKAKLGPWTLATVRHRVAVLSTAHRLKRKAALPPARRQTSRCSIALPERWKLGLAPRGSPKGRCFGDCGNTALTTPSPPAAVGEIVQRRAKLAGLEGDFGAHSLHSGFVTEASRQGVSLPAIMAMTEHRAVSSVMGYFQAGGAADNPAARLLEDH